MRIIKNREIVRTEWLPDSGGSEQGRGHGRILALDDWMEVAGNPAPSGRSRELPGVLLQPGDDPATLGARIPEIPVIAIDAGNFADGRVYSLAFELRRHHGYRGEIRGIGAIYDNLPLMEQCGFDAFTLKPGLALEEAIPYFTELGFDCPLR